MGIVVLMIVNLFSSLLHLNADFSERGKPLSTTFSCYIKNLLFLGGGMLLAMYRKH